MVYLRIVCQMLLFCRGGSSNHLVQSLLIDLAHSAPTRIWLGIAYILCRTHGCPLFVFTTMPPRKNSSNPASDRPCTRRNNANVHPGKTAQEALRVNAPRRDPAVIQKEKDAVKQRKVLRAQEIQANEARNEATKNIANEFRAQQASKRRGRDTT